MSLISIESLSQRHKLKAGSDVNLDFKNASQLLKLKEEDLFIKEIEESPREVPTKHFGRRLGTARNSQRRRQGFSTIDFPHIECLPSHRDLVLIDDDSSSTNSS